MGVLQIVDGVFVALLLGEVDVEDEFGIGLAGNEEEAGGVLAGHVDEVAQRDVVAGALAHLDGFAVLHDGEHLVKDVFGEFLRDAHLTGERAALKAAADAGNRAVMVGALNVDGLGEAALELGKVVGDVGHKVGKGAVDLAHHAVLVVVNAEVFAFGGLEPEGAVAFFGAAGVDHGLHGGLHAAGGVERGLEVEVVEVYAERIKVVVLLVAQIGDAVATDAVGVGKVALGFDDRAVMRMHGLAVKVVAGDGDHVFAVIGVFRKFDGFTLELAGAQADGFGEIADLNAGVVVVELAGDFPALSGEKIGKHVSEGALTGVAEMKRAGRVGGYEFEVQGLAGQVVVLAVVAAGFKHGVHHCGRGCGVERDVDEAGAGHFHGLDAVGIGQFGGEQFGEITWLHAGLLGQLHGRVGRPIAMCAVLRAHHGELGLRRNQIGGQGACLAFGDKGVGNVENQFTKGFWTHSSKNTGHADRISLPVHPHDGVAIRPAERFARRSEHRPARHAVSYATPRTRSSPCSTAPRTESCTAAWSAATDRKSPEPARRRTSQSRRSARTGSQARGT